MYICINHEGGNLYTKETPLEYNYCETCGDCDTQLGVAETEDEAVKLLQNSGYDEEYIEQFLYENYADTEVELNEHGINKKIKVHVLSDSKMREIGFTDYDESTWFFSKGIIGVPDISFSISINKINSNDFRIDVLDENFLQPYDYQYMLTKDPHFKYAVVTKEQVEHWMKYLIDHGVISGHRYGAYI